MVKAIITFDAKDVAGLQATLGEAGAMLQGAKGFHGIELRCGVEGPSGLYCSSTGMPSPTIWRGCR
jgi:hypothetical protein